MPTSQEKWETRRRGGRAKGSRTSLEARLRRAAERSSKSIWLRQGDIAELLLMYDRQRLLQLDGNVATLETELRRTRALLRQMKQMVEEELSDG